MMFKLILVCTFLVIAYTEAFVRRDVSSTAGPNILESFQRNLDEFRKCVDQSLAKTTADINEKQLQPVLTVVGDSLNRVSKAYDDLTAPSKGSSH